jgi:FMN phosphatase YigB (HAD superfamily)
MTDLSDIQAVLFDLGGTLVDYPVPRWPVMVRQCAGGVYGYFMHSESRRPPPAAVVPDADEAHARRPTAPPDAPMPHRAMIALRRVIRSLSGRTLPRIAEACARPLVAPGHLFEDSMPTVQALADRGYRMGVVSNTPWGTPEYLWTGQLERFGFDRYFHVRCFSSHIGYRKPDVRIFRVATEKLGVPPERTLFVGDTPEADVLGAHRAGMRSALIHRGAAAGRSHAAPAPDLRIARLIELLQYLPRAGGK